VNEEFVRASAHALALILLPISVFLPLRTFLKAKAPEIRPFFYFFNAKQGIPS
jgi:hypothetical protein